MKIGVIAITKGGKALAATLVKQLDQAALLLEDGKVADKLSAHWQHFDGFICIMAAGIVVRSIAPLLQHKHHDPCVIVMDEKGHHIVSLLSGHIGGGNDLARLVSRLTGGTAVITTSSDTLDLVPLDLWAKKQNLIIEDQGALTKASTKLVNQGCLTVHSTFNILSLPPGLIQVSDSHLADIIIAYDNPLPKEAILFSPCNLVIGTGCNRGTPSGEFEEALDELLTELHVSRASIRNLASIDKKNDETGLLEFAENNNWHIDFFDKDSINTRTNLEISFAALKAVGAIGVAEPAALLSAQSNQLLSRKRKWKNVTMAVAQAPFMLSELVQDQ